MTSSSEVSHFSLIPRRVLKWLIDSGDAAKSSLPVVRHAVRNEELAAANNVSCLGQRGGNANGFEGDSNGLVYMLMPEHNAVYYYDPADLQTHTFIRDPRIMWPDSASVAEDGYFYVNINQLPFQPQWNDGVDLRVKPGAVLRAKLPRGGSKIRGLV